MRWKVDVSCCAACHFYVRMGTVACKVQLWPHLNLYLTVCPWNHILFGDFKQCRLYQSNMLSRVRLQHPQGHTLYKYVPSFQCRTVFGMAQWSASDGHACTNNNCSYRFLPLTAWKTCDLKRHEFMTTLRHFSHPDILPNWQYWCIPTNWANIPFTNAIFVAFSRFCSLSSNSSCWVTRNKSHQTSSCETIRFSRDLTVTLPLSTRQPEALKAAVNPARKVLFVRRAMCIQACAWKGRRQNTSGDTIRDFHLVSLHRGHAGRG